MTRERIKQLHAIFVERYGEKCKRFSYLQETDNDLYIIRLQVSHYVTEMFHAGVFNSYLEYRKFSAFIDPHCIDGTLYIFHKN